MAWFDSYTYLPSFRARCVEREVLRGGLRIPWVLSRLDRMVFSLRRTASSLKTVRTFFDVFKESVNPDVSALSVLHNIFDMLINK